MLRLRALPELLERKARQRDKVLLCPVLSCAVALRAETSPG